MIYRTISSKYIIAKVLRDTNPQNDNFIYDAIEWLGEALEFVGTIPQYTLKTAKMEIEAHKAYLPCDLYLIEQVSYQGYPLRYSNNSFPFGLHCDDCVSNPTTGTTSPSFVWVTNPNDPQGDDGDNFEPVQIGFTGYAHETYYIDNNYIKTSFEEGDICLFYRAFNLDSDGYPLVPDYVQFKEACYWYIRMKMIGSGFSDPIFKYPDAEQRWIKYCTQARAKADIPSYDQMESIKNQWVRLIPQMNTNKDFYQTLGTPEELNRYYSATGFLRF
jgi:hypothetical protein